MMASVVLDGLSYAARRFFEGTDYILDHEYPRGLRRSAAVDAVAVVLIHRCNRRMLVPFDGVELMSLPGRSADIICGRLRACASLGCICDVRVVADRDTGDEDVT